MIRVVVADDDALIRAGVRAVLESAGVEVVGEASDGRSAVDLVLARRVDVALLDISMPRMDGLTAIEHLRAKGSTTRFVVLTAFGAHDNVVRAVGGGVAGFVLKNCEPGELVRAVRSAHAGEAYLSPAVTRLVLGMVRPETARRREEARRRLSALSPREAEVASLVADGLSNADVGARLHMSETTIKTYVSRILAKLDCANRVQAALLVRDAQDPGFSP
ncbi:two component system response regulator [Sphaerisporangium rubeum]|uniref:DNA-binding NarL/FixJ family response regulator n=1 Tax=Sphaerisporangium rubeum TaxID=321317 RepID=A0A7X0ID27_9ACTN|nr:DNA-binding NarL/FixJ family response regulator [Sphaerisporangium rubeum]